MESLRFFPPLAEPTQRQARQSVQSLSCQEITQLVASILKKAPLALPAASAAGSEQETALQQWIERAQPKSDDLETIPKYLVQEWLRAHADDRARWQLFDHFKRASLSLSFLEEAEPAASKGRSAPRASTKDAEQKSALFQAFKARNKEQVLKLLDQNPQLATAKFMIRSDPSDAASLGELDLTSAPSKDHPPQSLLRLAAAHLPTLVPHLLRYGAEVKDVELGLFPTTSSKSEDLYTASEKQERFQAVLQRLAPTLNDQPSIRLLFRLFAHEPMSRSQLITQELATFIQRFQDQLDHVQLLAQVIDQAALDDSLDTSGWKKLLLTEGPKVLDHLGRFRELQERQDPRGPLQAPVTYGHLLSRKAFLTYLEAIEKEGAGTQPLYRALFEKYRDWFLCFAHYQVKPAVAMATLKWLSTNPALKSSDELPEVDVHEGPYRLVKLPAQDQRGLILGEICDCCQSMGALGEPYVIQGMTKPKSGFYLLLKAKQKDFNKRKIKWEELEKHAEIVGQGLAWISDQGALVIDSLELLRPAHDSAVAASLLKQMAGECIVQGSVSLVTVGCGGKTPQQLTSERLEQAQKPCAGYIAYSDSQTQAIVHSPTTLLIEWLLKKNSSSFLKMLLQLNSQSLDGRDLRVLLHLARAQKATEEEFAILEKLRDLPSSTVGALSEPSIDEPDAGGKTALMWACDLGMSASVDSLIRQGAHLDICDPHGNSALFFAVRSSQEAIARGLCEAGAQVNLTNRDGMSPLTVACALGKAGCVQVLLQAQAAPDLLDVGLTSPLMYAAQRGYAQIVSLLLQAGASVDFAAVNCSSALLMAARAGQLECMNRLLEAGSNPLHVADQKYTLLHLAVISKNPQVLALVLQRSRAEASFNINAQQAQGCTALRLAVEEGFSQGVSQLLQEGADVNIVDFLDMTPLMVAAEKGHLAIARQLVEAGAELDLDDGLATALEHAQANHHEELAFFLRQAGAKERIESRDKEPIASTSHGG